ncbi:GNAT family N-acetyltransferase [uncultured Anaerococcus sp.]|uniref:GNAT family N-acetyltransferase n=1 Tax=uncultured Anaerococcus sp. TaxID=293428 RepID=UPI0026396D01|nr:GNAT family N-acetyltransferase [uncultured Anaerococcus sp.]
MNLLDVYKVSRKDYFEKLYLKSFPENERVDISKLYDLDKKGLIDIIILTQDTKYIGLAVIYLSENINLLSYFAIDPSLRSKGLGSKSLKILKNTYKDLIIEIESTDFKGADDFALRNRRKAFYIRNGFKIIDQKVDYFGIEMELMATTKDAGIEAYFQTYENIFDEKYIGENIKMIKI